MSKKELRAYIKSLKKGELEAQIIDLYERFKEVKTFYDFAFNPKEDELLEMAKAKIAKEYFPQTKRRPKARRSVAQNFIKQFRTLEMDPTLLADFMLYNIETAQAFSAERMPRQKPFFISMHRSFNEVLAHIQFHGIQNEFSERINAIVHRAENQGWENTDRLYESLDHMT